MGTIRRSFNRCAFGLALSMSAMPNLVNAQAQSLTSVNKDNSSTEQELKDSVKQTRPGVAQLIATVLKNGTDLNTGKNLSPVIGLPKAMRAKDVTVSQRAKAGESRSCFVVLDDTAEGADKRPMCAYIVKKKRTTLDIETQFFRIDLNGNLEKVVISKGKLGENGKTVHGSGVKTDLDIGSPEVKKTFEAEMKFWLKDWLKKEQQNAAKKTADAAAKKPSTTAL